MSRNKRRPGNAHDAQPHIRSSPEQVAALPGRADKDTVASIQLPDPITSNKRLTTTEDVKPKKRDALDVVGLLAGLALPVVLLVIGNDFNATLKKGESQTKMIELAINLLKEDPKVSEKDEALRNWAMDVIDKYSEVKLPPKVRDQLRTAPLEVSFGPPEGTATSAAARALNRLMNRDEIPNEADIDSNVTLSALLAPADDEGDENRFDENRAATIAGCVVNVKAGGITTANSRSKDPARRDTQIELGLSAAAPRTQCVIVNVTPRLRAKMKARGVDWTTEELRNALKGKWIEVTGWLLFNQSHINASENTNPGGERNWRATSWEIHPVTDIKVLDGPSQTDTK